MKFPFGPNKYNQPQVSLAPPVPEENSTEKTGTYINEQKRQIIVQIFDTGSPEFLATALGALEIAKDVVKQTLTAWHQSDRNRKGILVPKPNGNGDLHVQ